jgi:type I site-specific restriction endonuclease
MRYTGPIVVNNTRRWFHFLTSCKIVLIQIKIINRAYKKKNLIIGFTATPSDITLARFGEFNKYAEAEKIWVPFDSYTMKEAIEDGYILNPIKGIVPVSAKMYFEKPEDATEGFEGDTGYYGNHYQIIQKKEKTLMVKSIELVKKEFTRTRSV